MPVLETTPAAPRRMQSNSSMGSRKHTDDGESDEDSLTHSFNLPPDGFVRDVPEDNLPRVVTEIRSPSQVRWLGSCPLLCMHGQGPYPLAPRARRLPPSVERQPPSIGSLELPKPEAFCPGGPPRCTFPLQNRAAQMSEMSSRQFTTFTTSSSGSPLGNESPAFAEAASTRSSPDPSARDPQGVTRPEQCTGYGLPQPSSYDSDLSSISSDYVFQRHLSTATATPHGSDSPPTKSPRAGALPQTSA